MTRFLAIALAAAAILASHAFAGTTDTTVTYQGQLQQGADLANGSFDMSFSLWNALSGGAQVGAMNTFSNVPIAEGRFTVELDFGASAFDNSARWLEIVVEGLTLAPRQPITRAPYSIQTRGIFVDDAGNVAIGSATLAANLSVAGSVLAEGDLLALSPTDVPASSVFLGWGVDAFGAGVARIRIAGNGPGATSGLDIQRPGNVSLMRILDNGNVGIGTTTPSSKLTVTTTGASGVEGVSTGVGGRGVVGFTSADSGESVGVLGHTHSALGTGVYGLAGSPLGDGGDSIGVYGRTSSLQGYGVFGESSSHVGVFGYATSSTNFNYGVYGRSNNPTGYDFYAGGAGQDYGSSSSIRWKRNIELIDEPLHKIDELRGVYFDWDAAHGGHHDVGMIAEEVGQVLPEIVTYEANGVDANGMDYSKLTPLLVEAVKALRAEKDAELASLVAEKNSQIAALAAQVDSLSSRLAALERVIQLSFKE